MEKCTWRRPDTYLFEGWEDFEDFLICPCAIVTAQLPADYCSPATRGERKFKVERNEVDVDAPPLPLRLKRISAYRTSRLRKARVS